MSRSLISHLFGSTPTANVKEAAVKDDRTSGHADELLGKLAKFHTFSDEFKKSFVKQAEAIGMDRRGVFDTFAFFEKSNIAEKRGEYIRWLETIHQNA